MSSTCPVCGNVTDAATCGLCGSNLRNAVPDATVVMPSTTQLSPTAADTTSDLLGSAPTPAPFSAARAPGTKRLPLAIGAAALGVVGVIAAIVVPSLIAPPQAGAGGVPSVLPSSGPASAPVPTVTVTAEAQPAATVIITQEPQPAAPTVVVVPDPPAKTQTFPTVYVAQGKECARNGTGPFAASGTANATTSCPFAINVRDAYVEALNGVSGTIRAYSPTTKLSYDMECSGSQPVLCTGGRAGRVIIYGGDLRVG